MKKTILILSAVALTFASCKKEEITPTTPITITEPDCNCDEIVSVGPTFNVVGNIGDPNGPYQYGSYVTINQCTEVQVNRSWHEFDGDSKPVVGDCN